MTYVYALDNDKAGKDAMKKVYEYYKSKHNKIIKAKSLPAGIKDVTEYYLAKKQNE